MKFKIDATGDYAILIALLIAFLVTGLFGGVSIVPLLLLLFLQMSYIYMPGVLVQKFLKIEYKDHLSFVFSSYAVGFALSILLYTVLLLTNYQHNTCYFVYVISFVSLYGYCRQKKGPQIMSGSLPIILVFFIIMVVLGFAVYQYTCQSAERIGYQNIGIDLNYWFKNCVAVTKGYPMPELSVSGINLYWHVFSCFEVALFHFCTGMEIYDLCFYSSYVWQLFLLLGGTYVLTNEMLDSKRGVYLACVILLFCSALEPMTRVYYLEHMYGCKLGCADGQALSLFAVLFLFRFQRDIASAALALLFFICTLGAKASNGSIVLVVSVTYLAIMIIQRKQMLKGCCMGLLYFCFFLVISKIFLIDGNALTSESSSHKLVVSLSTAIHTPIGHKLFGLLTGIVGQYIAYAVALCVFCMFIHFVIMPLWGYATIFFIKKKYYCDPRLNALFFGALMGLMLFLFISHPGFSQMYFIFAAFPLAVVFSLMVLEKENAFESVYFRYGVYTVVFLCFLSGITLMPRTFCVRGISKPNHSMVCSTRGYDITSYEIQALRWVRDNIRSGAIFVTNKIIQDDSVASRSFLTSAYTEHQFYLEGWGATNLPSWEFVNRRLSLIRSYFEHGAEYGQQLVHEGVEYAIFYKGLGNHQGVELGNKIYENAAICIFQLCDFYEKQH